MSKVEIIIDHRERQVIPFIEQTERYEIGYTTRQLSIGDYLICTKTAERILAVVERKTWKDLAASFYDGRKENVNKLIELRKVSGCKIIYLLEGNPFRRSDEKIHRMPFKNLQAHLDHLLFRDDVHVVYTRDGRGSMQRLFDFANNLTTIKTFEENIAALPVQLTDCVADVNVALPLQNVEPQDVDEKKEDISDGDIARMLADGTGNVVSGLELALSTKRTPLSDVTIAKNLIKHLSSVGPICAEVLLDHKVTLKSLYALQHDAAFLAAIKTGKMLIGNKRAAKILNGLSRLSDVCVQVKLLAEIPQLSAKSAANIIAKYSLHQLLTDGVTQDELSQVMKTEKSKVGNALAASILRTLNFVL